MNFTLHKCRACEHLVDRIPRFANDGVSICPMCRTTEGGWDQLENCKQCNAQGDEENVGCSDCEEGRVKA